MKTRPLYVFGARKSDNILVVQKTVRIPINLTKERNRINSCGYNKREKKALLGVVDLFEKGKFKEAYGAVIKWDRHWREFLSCEIWDVLWDMNMTGAEYSITTGAKYEIYQPKKK